MAKFAIRAIYICQTVDNRGCQYARRRENDFDISIIFGDTARGSQASVGTGAENSCSREPAPLAPSGLHMPGHSGAVDDHGLITPPTESVGPADRAVPDQTSGASAPSGD